MIVKDTAANNHRLVLLAFCLFSATIFFILSAGCTNNNEAKDDDQASVPVPTQKTCGIQVDDSPWQVFSEFAERRNSGQNVPRDDLQVFADLPAISQWKESMEGQLASVRIVNWLDTTINTTPTASPKNKVTKNLRSFSKSYQYSLEHYQDVTRLIEKFEAGPHRCNFMEKVRFWVTPDLIPNSLTLVFLPSKPEIRILEDHLFVDTGVLHAGNMKQLENQLTGIFYRSRMMLWGSPPTAEEGHLAVSHSLRTMMNEGIVGCIENRPQTYFSPGHPKLGKVNIIEDQVFEYGSRAISLMNHHLVEMLANDEVMLKKGRELAKTLIASNSLNQGGYAMSATIVGHLGEQRLSTTSGSPALWLAAYQEAALKNPQPAPNALDVIDRLYLTMPPFTPEVYEGLLQMLKDDFPSS
ncbi:MAG: hypothetical protein GY780_09435 [bacterium]|nr:hypothetical protein [bacterium]